MKKIKLLIGCASLISLTAGLIPTMVSCGCSCYNNNGGIDLDESVTKQGVTVKSSNIQQGKLSTIDLNLPTGQVLSSAKVIVGSETLIPPDIRASGSRITIPADKMTSNRVTIKSVALEDATTKIVEPKNDADRIATVKIEPDMYWNTKFSFAFPGVFKLKNGWSTSDTFDISAKCSFKTQESSSTEEVTTTVDLVGTTSVVDNGIKIVLTYTQNCDDVGIVQAQPNTALTFDDFIIKNETTSEQHNFTLNYKTENLTKKVLVPDTLKNLTADVFEKYGSKCFQWTNGLCNFFYSNWGGYWSEVFGGNAKATVNLIINNKEYKPEDWVYSKDSILFRTNLFIYQIGFETDLDLDLSKTYDYGFKIVNVNDGTVYYEKSATEEPICKISFKQ